MFQLFLLQFEWLICIYTYMYLSLFYVRTVGCCNNMYQSVAIHYEFFVFPQPPNFCLSTRNLSKLMMLHDQGTEIQIIHFLLLKGTSAKKIKRRKNPEFHQSKVMFSSCLQFLCLQISKHTAPGMNFQVLLHIWSFREKPPKPANMVSRVRQPIEVE